MAARLFTKQEVVDLSPTQFTILVIFSAFLAACLASRVSQSKKLACLLHHLPGIVVQNVH